MDQDPNLLRRLVSDSEAAALISTLSSPTAAGGVEEAFVLLSRWARSFSQRQQHSPGVVSITLSQQETLTAAVHAATTILQVTAAADLSGAAAVLLLGSAAGAFSGGNSGTSTEEIAEIVGASLLSAQGNLTGLPLQQAVMLEHIVSGVAALVPPLSYNADATCWIFTAFLSYIGTIPPTVESIRILTSVYPAIRTATTAIMNQASSSNDAFQQQKKCLNSLYGALRAVLLPHTIQLNLASTNRMELCNLHSENASLTAATAIFAAGGMLEALARHQQQRPVPALIPLIEALAELLQHSATISTPTPNSSSTSLQNFLQLATGIAVAQTYQACRLPRPTPATLQCCVTTLLDTVLNIDPALDVLKYSSTSASAGQISAALVQQVQQRGWNTYAAPLQSTAVSQLSQVRLSPEQLDSVLNSIRQSAKRTHEQYRQYILQFWTQERAQVDYRPLQSHLEKNFLASMELLAASVLNSNLVSSSRTGKNTLKASTVLCIIADLQFCRVNTSPHYSRLLKDALQSLPLELSFSSSSAAITEIIHYLPGYRDLEVPIPAHGNAPAWLVDALSASKVQLLLTALAPCCGGSSFSEELALDGIAPLAFLYLLHLHPGTSTAAHTVLWSLMGAKAQHAEQLTPYYVIRCLEKIPLSSSSAVSFNDTTTTIGQDQLQHLQHFSQGLSTALATVAPGSPLGLLSVERILAKCSEMAGAGRQCWDDYCLAVFNVAVQQLLTVDYTLVDAVSKQLQEFIMKSPVKLKRKLSKAVFAMVVGTEDCVRKPTLARWYQDLSASNTELASL